MGCQCNPPCNDPDCDSGSLEACYPNAPYPPCLPPSPAVAPPSVRTTSALVMGIIQTETGIDLTPFIATANMLVTGLCSNSGYSDGFVGSQLELIERWVSGHVYTIFDNQLVSARAGTAAVTFQQKIDFDLRTSMYGQMAIMLDFQGNLARWCNSAKTKRQIRVGVFAAGRNRNWPGDVDFGSLWADLTVEQ
jgi:hypothetical protein